MESLDKLLTKLDENEPEIAVTQEEECVICVSAKATMETWPCGHRVVCRKCLVKTIQTAVAQRVLPLRCVICRAKILRLKQAIPASASAYIVGAVPPSHSLYSMASTSSSISGCSSTSSSSAGSSCSRSGPIRQYLRQPTGSIFRKHQAQSMKHHLQEYKEPVNTSRRDDKMPRLTPIQEFQREFRLGKARSSSTRIRCAHKIVTQLEGSGSRTTDPHRSRNDTLPQQSVSREPSSSRPPSVEPKSRPQQKLKKEPSKEKKEKDKKEAKKEKKEAKEAKELAKKEAKEVKEQAKKEAKEAKKASKKADKQ